MAQLLLYEDPRALSAYLAGAALLDPDLPDAQCAHLGLDEGQQGLLFVDAIGLPVDQTRGTRLVPATLEGGRVRWSEGETQGETECGPSCALAQAVPPVPSAAIPTRAEVLYLVHPGQPFARLVTHHLELGIDDLRYASVHTSAGERIAVEVTRPSWFLLERWLQDFGSEAAIYRRLDGVLGPRSIYVEWGYQHPLETWLRDPADDQSMLLIDASGLHQTLTRGQLQDIGDGLRLEPSAFPTEELAPAAAPELLEVKLRLESRTVPASPELWILPAKDRARLETLLTQTPEEELKNLLVACVEDPSGERLLCVREVIAGRAPRLLPLGQRAYAPLEGQPNLLVPCPDAIAPTLSPERYTKAFGVVNGSLTVLDRHPEDADASASRIHVTRIPKAAFGQVERIVSFVFDGHAKELEAALLQSPFDLGSFAEEDLVPPLVKRPKEKAPLRRPEPPVAEPEQASAPKPKSKLLERLMRPFKRPQTAEPEGVEASAEASDPRREEAAAIEREIALGTPQASHWLRLGQLGFELDEASQGLSAFEHGLWLLEGDEAAAAEEELRRLTQGKASPEGVTSTRDLYAQVLAYREEVARQGNDADAYRRATEAIYALLRSEEDRLRKKSRWLLWSQVLLETGDTVEAERQREALLSDLVLRGVEEREVPRFVPRVLLREHGQQAAAGSRAQGALAFLRQAETFTTSLPHPAVQAVSLGHVAWALAELGQSERATQLAQRSQDLAASRAGTPPYLAWRGEAQARIGSVAARTGGREAGRPALTSSLETIRGELRAHPEPRDADGTRARKALVAWLGVVSELWGSEMSRDPLLQQALDAIGELALSVRSNVLLQARRDLETLGLGTEARALLAELLQPQRLKEAERAFQDMSTTPMAHNHHDAYRTHVQNAMTALGDSGSGAGFQPAEAEVVVAMFKDQPELVDEFAIDPFLQALRVLSGDPWTTVQATYDALMTGGHAYQARLLVIAGLRRLAELHDRQRGPELLERAIEEAWSQEGERGKFRIRLVTRLVDLIPAFGMRERGLKLLAHVQSTVEARDDDTYCKNEMLMATTLAASQLGDSQASFDLVERAARVAMDEFKASEGRTRHLLFDTLASCVRGAGKIGDARRGQSLVDEVAQAAEDALAESGPKDLGRFFYCVTLIACGSTSMLLGEAKRAGELFESVLEHVKHLSPFDQKDLLLEAADTAAALEGDQRYTLAAQVLEGAQPIASKGNLHNAFAMQLVGRLVREMVKGESAFANALKRWKAREERAIRDRVAHEGF